MSEPKSKNIVWHHATITKEDREKLFSQKGVVIWFTGLSGSGKSTLANAVEATLFERGCHTYILDGDNIRHGLNKDLGFSPKDREENIRRIGEVAHLFAQAGVIVMTAFISPYRADRDLSRKLNPEGVFIEIYCRCSLRNASAGTPRGSTKRPAPARSRNLPGYLPPMRSQCSRNWFLILTASHFRKARGRCLPFSRNRELLLRNKYPAA